MSDPMFSEQFYFNESLDLQANQMDYQAGSENFHVAKDNNMQRPELPKIQIFSEIDNQINPVQPGMQFEEIRMDRLNILNDSSVEAQPRSGSDGDNSRGVSSNDRQGRKQKKTKKEDQQQLKDRLQSQILLNLGQTKSTYTNKIQSLVKKESSNQLLVTTKSRQSRSQQKLERKNEQQIIHAEQSEQSSSENVDSLNDGNLDQNQLKQVRNRESARNSRARKKIYFELLETRVQELQEENDQLRESCNNLSKSVENFNKQQDKFQQFLEQQQKLFERLETCLIQGKDVSEIEILLDALKYRTSSNKQERLEAAKSFSYSILDVCLPLQTKYLFSIVEVDRDFFSSNQKNYTDYLKDILKKSEIKPDQNGNIEKTKQKLIQTKLNIRESFKKIKNEIKNIQNEAVKVDQLWEQLKENLSPDLLAQCLITLHRNEFRADFQVSTLFKKRKSLEKQEHQLNGMQIETQINQRKQVKKSS